VAADVAQQRLPPFVYFQPPHSATVTVITALAMSANCSSLFDSGGEVSNRHCAALGNSPAALHSHKDVRSWYKRWKQTRSTSSKIPQPLPFMFTFVRDPWSRVLTCAVFHGAIKRGHGSERTKYEAVQKFRAWARANFRHGSRGECAGLGSSLDYARLAGTDVKVDFIGYVSQLSRDFARLCARLGLPTCIDVDSAPQHCVSSCPHGSSIWATRHSNNVNQSEFARLHSKYALTVREAYDEHTARLVERAWQVDVEAFNFSFALPPPMPPPILVSTS
jgi:hypothetical protein